MAQNRIGIWLIGAKGGVATTTIVGLTALKEGLIGSAGLVTQLPQFADLTLPDWADFVVGGHEIRDVLLADEAMRLATESRTATPGLIDRCRAELDRIERRIRPGTVYNVGPTISELAAADVPGGESPRQAVDRVRGDLDEFVEAHRRWCVRSAPKASR